MPSQPFTYAVFIRELEVLIAESQSFETTNECHHRNPEFRRWLHALKDLLIRIEQRGVMVNCDVGNREFRALFHGANAQDDSDAFRHDMTDTVIELVQIVEGYKRFGFSTPKRAPEPEALKYPDKGANLAWLAANLPLSVWVAVGTALVFTFGLGLATGGTKLGQTALDWVKPADPAATAAKPAKPAASVPFLSLQPYGETPKPPPTNFK
jgi:hypothetical protein